MALFGSTNKSTYTVKGMTCGHCEMRVRDALSGVEGVKKVEVDRTKDQAVVHTEKNTGVAVEELAKAVEEAGYTLVH